MGWNGPQRPPSPSPHCRGQGHLSLDQVDQEFIQTGTEHFQVWGIHNLPEQTVVVSNQSQNKRFLPNI